MRTPSWILAASLSLVVSACGASLDGPYPCGSGTCADREVCVGHAGGARVDGGAPPTTYACIAAPAGCNDPAACISAFCPASIPGTARGRTVTCDYP
ncbi:MAG: hypothetical protein WCJ30_06260 [Deltaproteobacteria bacterium]